MSSSETMAVIQSPLDRDVYVHQKEMRRIAREFIEVISPSLVSVHPRELMDALIEEGYEVEYTEVLNLQETVIDAMVKGLDVDDAQAAEHARQMFEEEVSARLAEVLYSGLTPGEIANGLAHEDIVAEIIDDVRFTWETVYCVSAMGRFTECDVRDAIIRLRTARTNDEQLRRPEVDTEVAIREAKLARAAWRL